MSLRIGIDIGSTTVKVVVLDEQNQLLFRSYERHFSKVREKACEILNSIAPRFSGQDIKLVITGSAGLGVAKASGVDFVQEVYATAAAVNEYIPNADAVIELGGEDAKIIFFGGALEERMNGSCAGGTGAFIDQMATLMNVTADELDELSLKHEKIYPIASRCGVFAKSDIQPILNQGGRKEDVAASIFQAVVDQTIAGLTQGRELKGKIVFLGGPLHFLQGLRERFVETLKLDEEHAIFPEDGDCFAAIGAALCAGDFRSMPFDEALRLLEESREATTSINTAPQLFRDEAEYKAFCERHNASHPPEVDPDTYTGDAYLGIDAGSTTTKLVLIAPDGGLLYTYYHSNQGNPVSIVREQLEKIYALCGDRIQIRGSAVTGYGEDLILNAFRCDLGLVETVAHLNAARHFNPDVDFIIDIGGQDMKCFKIEDGAISNIFLNEACSSGCGSFLQTFAQALGYDVKEFAALGLFADKPVDLGSRCTVFMNSSVKQAQKDGASIENISAGLSISVVKNALYKVIRASSPEELGRNIVVQGGTFYNEAVLRAFEKEMGVNVIRPDIAGLMGAYGAALYGKAKAGAHARSTVLTQLELEHFSQKVNTVQCQGCGNHCQLTVNVFADGKRFISGNRCDKPVTGKANNEDLDLYAYKLKLLDGYRKAAAPANSRGKVGIPLCLNMYELLPFWHTLFSRLGFEVVVSPFSNRKLYQSGQATIPSDTACFPAKLSHGHIHWLCEQGVDAIFYPCMSYNLDEHLGDNHYNCPVVAYYPEVLEGNCPELKATKFIYDYFNLERRKDFYKKFQQTLDHYFPGLDRKAVHEAIDAAYDEYARHMQQLRDKGTEIIAQARREGRRIIVLAGRPYHVDPEVNHGIDQLIIRQGAAVISEDSVSWHEQKFQTSVLNQWTYHSRLYAAAKYCTENPDMDLVQLVSFGCGLDAVTTDETREILQAGSKLYTQLKIDEITNLGAVNIRLRSLFAALEERKEDKK
uniref:acyl-CoA dehydratase activase n=1 Tax=Gemmiger formicilis TaxID=745368 RepID=UPI0040263EB9